MHNKRVSNEGQRADAPARLKAFWNRFSNKTKLGLIPWSRIVKWVGRMVRRRVLPVCCVLLCTVILFSAVLVAISAAVRDKTQDRILTATELSAQGEGFDYVLILGCGVYPDGTLTPMLYDRVTTGAALYANGIGKRVLMSGDHSTAFYDEVGAMQREAVQQGVPAEAIDLDPYGLSTYDSIVRLASHRPGARVVIVTQEYHLPRALYIAQKLGLDAYGVSADLRTYRGQAKYSAREIVARCKDVLYTQIRQPAVEGAFAVE